MSLVYLFICIAAALFTCDDMALGHIHPIKGMFIMLAVGWNVARVVCKLERKYK